MNNISFPKLGLSFNINPVAFTVFGNKIYWYAILILTGFLLAVLFCSRSAKKRSVNPDNIIDIALYGLIFGLIGARLYYVIFDLKAFNSIGEIFAVWEGGLAIYGGLIGAVISTVIYCKVKKLSFFKLADICAPGLLIGQIIGRLGNFVNAEVFGTGTSSFLGMSINGSSMVHPLFLYEGLWNLLGLILILCFRDKKKADGQVICGYFFWYGFGRLFLEGMRQKAYILYLIDGVLAISQLVSILIMIASAVAFIILTKKKDGFKA